MVIHAHESSFYFVGDNAHLHNIENFHSYKKYLYTKHRGVPLFLLTWLYDQQHKLILVHMTSNMCG